MGVSALIRVANNFVTANNLPPILIGNLSNLTWNEDTSIGFNISGNYSDPNNDPLSYNFTGITGPITNLSISINNATGTINITPSPNYFGSQLIQFFAFDGDNATSSNTISLTVIGVNDLPNASLAVLISSDSLNRSNGTLSASWTYGDIEGDSQAANETLWYLNGIEAETLRNLTSLGVSLTNKTQNWTFSVRSFDGANFSAYVNSTSLMILNSPPTHSIPLITSNDGLSRLNGTLSCINQSASDADSDALSLLTQWYKNNVSIPAAADSLALNAGNFSKNDNLTCEMAISDGESNSTRINSSAFTIQNAAPIQNTTIPDKSWDQDTSTSFNISAYFIDIDNDALAFNYSAVTNIAISIVNSTGIATLTPSAGYSGSQSMTFFASDGSNTTQSNSVTLTVNAISSPSSQSSSSGGGGSGAGGYLCRLDWECTPWSGCEEGEQSRKCKLEDVSPFRSLTSCPQSIIPEQKRACEMIKEIQETCEDNIKNQDEEETDCGGVCAPCIAPIEESLAPEPQADQDIPAITGAVVGGAGRLSWIIAGILAAVVLGIFTYAKLSRPKNLSQEEVNRILRESGAEPYRRPEQAKIPEQPINQEKKF